MYKQVFDVDPASCLVVSAKHGRGLDQVLCAIIDRIPAPQVSYCLSSIQTSLLSAVSG